MLYPSSHELQMIKSYIVLSLVLDVFERDRIQIIGVVKTPNPYDAAIQAAMDRITKDISGIRQEFRQRGIKMHDSEKQKEGIRTLCVCRGYEQTVSMFWDPLRFEIETAMTYYLRVRKDDAI